MSQGPQTEIPDGCYKDDIKHVLVSKEQIDERIKELAAIVEEKYAGEEEDLILLCVLKGAVFFITDFARALNIPTQMEFMAVSSYGNATSSSGVVRILKDLDRDIKGANVVIVEDIIDSGLTLSWLVRNLKNRGPKSLEIVTLLRKPEAVKNKIDLLGVGFDIPNEFVVGYGLDYAERYRDLPYVATLKPSVYEQ
ncbi:MAG: hypoxanthine phosphoribosyltransferase [Corynebacterium sp.]|nr:hypoxanthine phosphoribosyltransferase [Corynebacterium sp.]